MAKSEVAMELQAVSRADRRRSRTSLMPPPRPALLLDHRGKPAQLAPPMMLQRFGQAPAPVRMRVGRARQVGLLGLAGDILDLHQHQSGARAGEVALDRLAKLRPRRSARPLPAGIRAILGRQQSFARPARRAAGGGRGRAPPPRRSSACVGIEVELAPPGDVAAEPESLKRREVMRRGRGGGQRRILCGGKKRPSLRRSNSMMR